MKLTKDTLTAFLTVVILAGAALGFANKTEAMIDPLEMAKLGIHKMPNGDWMAGTDAGGAEAGGGEHAGHNVPNDGISLLERLKHQRLGHVHE